MKLIKHQIAMALAGTLLASSSMATVYFVNPAQDEGVAIDGYTADTAFASFEDAMAVATGGDTIYLLSGDYGSVLIDHIGEDFETSLVIKAKPGEVVNMEYLHTYGSSNLSFSGLNLMPPQISPYDDEGNLRTSEQLAELQVANRPMKCGAVACFKDSYWAKAKNIVFENNTVKSFESLTEEQAADKNFWADFTETGVATEADNSVIANNHISNVAGGISIGGTSNSRVIGNSIRNMGSTGIGVSGAHHAVVDSNELSNFYRTRSRYAAGGYPPKAIGHYGGESTTLGVVISNNLVISAESDALGVSNIGLGGAIMSYHGILKGWTVTGNVIQAKIWHTITLNDTVDLIMSHNVMLDPRYDSFGIQLGGSELTSELTTEQRNQSVTCNLMPHIGASNALIEEFNVLTFLDSENWQETALDLWDSSCNAGFENKLTF
ncbi:MAG: right-handed parallel beta-helix repeat-containing protein [Oceanobacter sp.]